VAWKREEVPHVRRRPADRYRGTLDSAHLHSGLTTACVCVFVCACAYSRFAYFSKWALTPSRSCSQTFLASPKSM
jgi:hypothetical protein